jgi:hypothetical protein
MGRGGDVQAIPNRVAGDVFEPILARFFVNPSRYGGDRCHLQSPKGRAQEFIVTAFDAAFNLRVTGAADLMARGWHIAMRES